MLSKDQFKILLFNSLFFASLIFSILTLFSKPQTQKKNLIFPASSRHSVYLLNLYNIIEYQSLVNQVSQSIDQASKNKNVKALVLQINSGGGTVAATQAIYQKILQFKQKSKKPVVAVLGDVAASGAYYIACASDHILAQPGTITGSIGVIMSKINISQFLKNFQIIPEVIKSGPHKDIGSITRQSTQKEKNILQNIVNNTYQQFFQAVLLSRTQIPENQLKQYADGRIFNGKQALQLGFIDSLGGIPEALSFLQKKLNTPQPLNIIQKKYSLLERLLFLLGRKSIRSSNPPPLYQSISEFIARYPAGYPLYIFHPAQLGENF